MPTRSPRPKTRVDPVRAALGRLADAQEATQAELHDLVTHVRRLTEAQQRTEKHLDSLAQRMDQLAEAQRRTEETLQQLIVRLGRLEDDVDGLVGHDLERHYRDNATSLFQRILRKISVTSKSDLDALADETEAGGAITIDERQDVGLADVIVRGVSRVDGRETYLVAEVSRSVHDRDVVRAQRRAAIVARVTGLPAVAAVCGERIRPDADSSARAAGLWRVLNGITLAPTDTVPPERLARDG